MDLIFHHYPQSPFSEKIRLMLGYGDLRWLSLESPPKPPRPNLDPLTGGYRRIPVAQLGADIFCDTKIIAAEVAALAKQPLLAPENNSEDVLRFCQRSEQEVFIALFSAIPSRLALTSLLKQLSLWQLPGFIFDRMKMTRGSNFKMLPLFEAQKIVQEHLIEMEARLEQAFLFGEQPTIADFSIYPVLWMLSEIAPQQIPAELTQVHNWLNRMRQFGHGHPHKIERKLAFDLAASCEPRPIESSLKTSQIVGKEVSIAPDDYAKNPVAGELAGETQQRWIIRRKTHEFGSLHLHFPKTGYQLDLL